MMISRAKAGFVMIGVSVFLFLLAGSTDNLETQMGVTRTAFLGNFLSIAGLALIGLGIYLLCSMSRAATHRHYRGHNFDTAPRSHRWNWLYRLSRALLH